VRLGIGVDIVALSLQFDQRLAHGSGLLLQVGAFEGFDGLDGKLGYVVEEVFPESVAVQQSQATVRAAFSEL
jgi:hypothetical protein